MWLGPFIEHYGIRIIFKLKIQDATYNGLAKLQFPERPFRNSIVKSRISRVVLGPQILESSYVLPQLAISR